MARQHRRRGGLSHAHLAIGAELLRLATAGDGAVFPSRDTLAERGRCCLSTVAEANRRLRRLRLLGWVKRIRVRQLADGTADAEQESNAYWLLVPGEPPPDVQLRPRLPRWSRSESVIQAQGISAGFLEEGLGGGAGRLRSVPASSLTELRKRRAAELNAQWQAGQEAKRARGLIAVG